MPPLRRVLRRGLLGKYGFQRSRTSFGRRAYSRTERFRAFINLDTSTYEQILAECPRTVRAKADKLLLAIERRTKEFGDAVVLEANDYPLGYARSYTEFRSLSVFLEELKFIKLFPTGSSTLQAAITGAGFTAIESRLMLPALTVFMSSTCYDLLDPRGIGGLPRVQGISGEGF